MSSDARRLAWLLVGVALLQAAWIWVLPPFGGLDEVDHAYRAASVARGHFVDREPTESGRGDLILVPRDLVSAAHFRCHVLKYMGPANCRPTDGADHSGQVHVASAAATYNPAYYVVAGGAALPFDGTEALYGMRVATALLCDVFLALALWVGLRRSRSAWPNLGILICSTPVLLCATATAAPNGPEMSAALTLWSAGAAVLATRRFNVADRANRGLLLIASVAACTIIVTHTTGLLWVAATLIGLVMALGRTRSRELWDGDRRIVVRHAVLIGAVALLACAWILSQHTNDPAGDSAHVGSIPWGVLFAQPFLWVLQTIGAVPMRDQPAPTPVFVLGLLLFCSLIGLGIRRTTPNVRRAMGLIATVCLAVPLAATIATYDALGFAWQGRYELPLAYGLLVLSAWSMGAWMPRRFKAAVSPVVVVAVTLMQLLAIVHVRALVAWSPADGGQQPSTGVLVALVVLAGAALLRGMSGRRDATVEGIPVPVRQGAPA